MYKSTARSLAVLFTTFFISTSSHALAGFSRSCSLVELYDKFLLPPVMLFVDLLSDRPIGTFSNRYTDSSRESLIGAFIPESITTDYGSARYQLYARSRAYLLSPTTQAYEVVRDYKSRLLDSPEILNQVIRQDYRFSLIFSQNGLIPYSSRAGSPQLIETIYNPGFIIGGSSPTQPNITVVGNHQYYNYSTLNWISLARSSATNCNLTEWGFEHR